MKKQMLLLIGVFIFSFIKSQNTEYISIGNDQYGNSLFYKIDKTLNNEFYFWFKIEYTLENDPGMSKSEYYLHAKCDNKTEAILKYKNDWRKDDEDDRIHEATKDQIKYVQTSKNHKTYFLFEKNCKK